MVTNLPEPPKQLDQDFYVQRGAVPERPIGELKNGRSADRLSTNGFCANAFEMLVAVTAYALVVLYRQACAAVEGVGNAEVETLRNRLWKVPAEVVEHNGAVRVRLPCNWEYRHTWEETLLAVRQHVTRLNQMNKPPGPGQRL